MLADLKNLPARCLASCSLVFRTEPTYYLCTHGSQPPEGQIIHTDQSTSALLRIVRKRESSAVTLKKCAELKDGKRPHESMAAGGAEGQPAKKLNTGAAAVAAKASQVSGLSQHLTTTSLTAEELKAKTVPQLKELLRARGLAVSGAKDELVRRLVDHQRANKYK
ncbi:hypothetical protein VOLCADRAFT_60634 [Volvox carteri f. nagariensis]|uniref:SAP domain-containing protein n=1 Tax=Volvox carteri f. nagariensis TaxID=3068 RepID=D8TW03_VOLCA|nr:uncharacterized protein VOLCADRAFT_60634 [Volvox carteri f. nagariensis]EFJ48284.1 hypothetical protein VOLCADRAFT_60634 [Volvox carteri f. nagariensis]|eukprot:XP_002950538.1 hypothetical protein VOLCADRAFT_60634 [Volvox carteri f. nagariensis]